VIESEMGVRRDMDSLLFDDVFLVMDIDPDGKKFDRGK
jgi:hypothetical protein